MPDNVTIGAYGPVPTAYDDVGGVLHRRVKVGYGPDGAYTDVSTGNPLPVTMAGGAAAGVGSPTVFRTVQATAGGTIAVWQPATGKRWRLMRYTVEWCGDGATVAAGLRTMTWHDQLGGGLLPIAHNVYVGAGFLNHTTGWVDLGDGVLSGAADSALMMNLSAGMSPGYTRVTVAGREE